MNQRNELRLLVLADPHVALHPRTIAAVHESRNGGLGLELLRRAIEDARNRGGFDAIASVGDVLNDGHAPDAEAELRLVAAELQRAVPDVPLLVVPGNHDGDPQRLLQTLGTRAGGHDINGCRLFVFVDHYDESDVCTRPADQQQAFVDWAEKGSGPIVVLQHNPLTPEIEGDYPYMLVGREKVMADYARLGVLASLSGHYHQGQAPRVADGVTYFTAAALCEGEWPYAVATIRGREIDIERRQLRLPEQLGLIDGHAHTEFAYCGRNTSADGVIDRARRIGLAGVRLVEHAPQLYCSKEQFWVGRHIFEPALWHRAEHSRTKAFRSAMMPRRDGFAKIGLEVELDADDRLTLHDEDRWVDLLVGAIHWLKRDPREMTDAEMGSLFMATCEGLIAGGAKVLAHPWRIFSWARRPVPTDLYNPLADLLAATGTAAEINFHVNWSDPAFFAACVERGAKIAFGSDAHELYEVGSFGPHLDVLRQAAGSDDPAVLRGCLAEI